MLLSLQEQKKALSADVNKLDKDIKRLKGMLIERMGTSCTAVYNGLAESYTVTYNPYAPQAYQRMPWTAEGRAP